MVRNHPSVRGPQGVTLGSLVRGETDDLSLDRVYQVELGEGWVLFRAIRKLAGKRAAVHGVLPQHHVPGLASRVTGPLGGEALFYGASGFLGVFFQVIGEALGHHGIHISLHLSVAQLTLGLAFELGVQ